MIPLMKYAFSHETETRRALAEFVLQTPILSMHQKCFEFERVFAASEQRKDAVLFNSGGSANLAMLQALKNLGRLKDGDRVGFSALTWSTNTMPILQLGMVPVAVDCEPRTLNCMSRHLLERLQTVPLQAFFLTNVLGLTGDLAEIRRICTERKIILLEDNCESLGTELPEGRAGGFGVAASFSFYVAHHLSTIEGGMVCTDDPLLGQMLRIVRANGWDRNLSAEQQHHWREQHGIHSEMQAKYTFYDLGYNLRPTEVTGFLGLEQIKYLPDNIQCRERNFLRLQKAVGKNPDLRPLEHGHIRVLSSFAFVALARTPQLRNQYAERFSKAGVEIRPVIAGNMQRQPFYAKYVQERPPLPGADIVHDCGFYFGNYPELSEQDLQTLEACLATQAK